MGPGPDLPAKKCPRCGAPMEGDGHDIPVEAVFGIYGDKVVDFNWNLSGRYRGYALRSLRKIFGDNRVIDPGRVIGVSEWSAGVYVDRYARKHGLELREAGKRRLAMECSKASRTSGTHPYGVFLIPDDMRTDFITIGNDCIVLLAVLMGLSSGIVPMIGLAVSSSMAVFSPPMDRTDSFP